jgi:hypothetical protein
MTKKVSRKIASKARAYLRARDAGKNGYAQADRIFSEIRANGMKPGDEVVINAAGDKVVLKDLYATADKVFRAHGIGRFELDLVKAS